jgi:hypothetical protein
MKIHCAVLLCVSSAIFSVCHAADTQLSVPARLQSPNAEVRQELREVTAKFLGLSKVVLAEDTLTNASQFMFSRTPRYDASGQLLQGRVTEAGHIFKLMLRVDGCWLTYQHQQNKEQQEKLSLAKCVPE